MDLMTDFLTGYVVPAGAGLAGDPGLKAPPSTGGAQSVFETSVGAGPPPHVHDREDECFYMLDGELSIRCGGDAFGAAAGSFVFLPRGRAPVLGRGPARPAAADRRPRRHRELLPPDQHRVTDDEHHRIVSATASA
jgi:quercetin dioxygenase-like cupin family protein